MIKENYRLTLEKRLCRLRPASNEEIAKVVMYFDAIPRLHYVRDIVRVIANTGIHNHELGSLRVIDVDINRKCLRLGQLRKCVNAARQIPLGVKTLSALLSLHQANPESSCVLGEHPRTRLSHVTAEIRSNFPEILRGQRVLYSVRLSFVHRLMSAGIPLGIVNYLLCRRDLSSFASHLALTAEQRFEIVRRNLSSFLEEL